MMRAAILALLAAVLGACSNGGRAAVTLFDDIAALALRTSATPPGDAAWILERRVSALLPVAADASIGASAPVEAPPGGWPQFGVRAWQTATDTVLFATPISGNSFYTSSYNVAASAGTAWKRIDGVTRIVLWEGAPLLLSDATIATSDANFSLPPDARTLPHETTRAGFAYLAHDGALAWWDPVSGATRWRAPLALAGSVFAYDGERAAWFEPGRVVTATVSHAGMGSRAWAPLDSAAIAARFDDVIAGQLWFTTANGRLQRVTVSATEPGLLCYRDSNSTGSTVNSAAFVDVSAISDVQFRVVRSDRPACPGWTLDDEWVVEFGRAPTFWTGLNVAPDMLVTDLPFGQSVTNGDVLLTADGVFTVTATTPLRFDPPLPGPVTGDLVAATRWVVFTARRGDIGVVASGQDFDDGGLAFAIDRGSDPADTGDRFVFTTQSGITSIQTTGTILAEWNRIDDSTALAIDRKIGTVLVFSAGTGRLTETIE